MKDSLKKIDFSSQRILTVYGEKPIEEVNVGDEVIGFDYDLHKIVNYIIKSKSVFDFKPNKKIVLINEKYFFAPHQSIYANGNITHTFRLQIGDKLKSITGEDVQVESIRLVRSKVKNLKQRVEIGLKENFFTKIFRKQKNYHTYFLNGILVHNATRYAVGGTNTWSAAGTGMWSASSGGASGASAPTSSDDAVIDANSGGGTVSLDTATTPVCQSLNMSTAAAMTFSWQSSSSATLKIGSSAGGALNVGTNVTFANVPSSGSTAFQFVSTSNNGGSGWPITTNGKLIPASTFNGVGGQWQFQDNFTANSTGSGATFLTAGTLDCNAKTFQGWSFNSTGSAVRALILTNATFNLSSNSIPYNIQGSNITVTTGGETFNLQANSDSITYGGGGFLHTATGQTFAYTTINILPSTGVNANATPLITLASTVSITSLIYTGAAAAKTWNLQFAQNTTITNLTVNGANSNTQRILVSSNSLGNARTLTVTTLSTSNTDWQDITAAGGANWDLHAITGNSGNALGCTGITFTTPAMQTWQTTASGNWSDITKWTSRVPLPQDNVAFGNAFSASQTITANMPRLGANIDFTGTTGSPILNYTVTTSIYGSLYLATGMSLTETGGLIFFCSGRSALTITSNGSPITSIWDVNAPGGTYTHVDNFNIIAGSYNLANGTLDCATHNVNMTAPQYSFTAGTTLSMGSGTWIIVNITNSTVWSMNGTLTNATGSTIIFTGNTANTQSFSSSSGAYGTITDTAVGRTGILQMLGAFSFNTLSFSNSAGPRTLTFGQLQTRTCTGAFNVNGSANGNITINSNSAGNAATLLFTGAYPNCDYLTIQDNTVSNAGLYPAYAGPHSTLVSNTTRWIAAAEPPTKGFLSALGAGA